MLFVPKGFRNKYEFLYVYLKFLRDKVPLKVCYVSGPISKSNELSVAENICKLNDVAIHLDASGDYDVVINPSAVGDLEQMGYSRADALYVWVNLLKSGRIGVVAMILRWENSVGAQVEHETALKHGLKIIYLSLQVIKVGEKPAFLTRDGRYFYFY